MAVQIADHLSQFGERSLQVAALLVQELRALGGLPVLLLGQRVDRSQPFLPPLQLFDGAGERAGSLITHVVGAQLTGGLMSTAEVVQGPPAFARLVLQVGQTDLHLHQALA